MQWWIDTIGKLGPFAVAVAVFMMNRSQNDWTNQLARRSSAVEDQKLRLALLERRLVAVDAFHDAIGDFSTHGRVNAALIGKVFNALRVARVVFSDIEEVAITACLHSLVKWQQLDRETARWRDRDQAKLERAVDDLMNVEQSIEKQLTELAMTLQSASRVQLVPPLPERAAIFAWLGFGRKT